MNIKNIKKVRDVIAAIPAVKFNMRVVFENESDDPDETPRFDGDALLHACGTAGCIAGWACAVLGQGNDSDDAGDLFGLPDSATESHLFMPSGYESGAISRATPAHAVAVLDRLIETGNVDWDWAMANPADLSGAAS